LYIDRFGNAMTNLNQALPIFREPPRVRIRVAGRKSALPLMGFYEAVRQGQPLALIGSTGCLEIAVNGGDAARTLGLKVGDVVGVEKT
jgi:S-adenosylmethionine hydrolase